MAKGDLELALRAVERQAAAMQAIERKIAALYSRRSGDSPATAPPNDATSVAALADCEAAHSGFAREILARPDRDQILDQIEKAYA
jgi:hypothetical protein